VLQIQCLLSSEAFCIHSNICFCVWEVHFPSIYVSLWQAFVKLEAVCLVRVLFEKNPQHRAYGVWWKSWSLFRDGVWDLILDILRTAILFMLSSPFHLNQFFWPRYKGLSNFFNFFFAGACISKGMLLKPECIYSLLYIYS